MSHISAHPDRTIPSVILRWSSKFLVLATLLLIFVGGLVKSTESGLSVPDWPTTYGYFMFSFPLSDMVGGILYEHGHRMFATLVGLLMLVLAVWIQFTSQPRWIKITAWVGLLAVIIQGLLGGLTVKFFLPATISVAHGVLAQTFFLLTIFLAYALSCERVTRPTSAEEKRSDLYPGACFLLILIFIQLMLGAVMRHLEAGLAVYDFPTMAGQWWPEFSEATLGRVNHWRFEHNFPYVDMTQVAIHVAHRIWAGIILLALVVFDIRFFQRVHTVGARIRRNVYALNITVAFQIALGIATVLSQKEVATTTSHVATGAALLGICFLLCIRTAPLRWAEFRKYFA